MDMSAHFQVRPRGLSVGDRHAPDIAQESHVNALRAVCCMRDGEALEYRKKLPYNERRLYEGVMIDDRVGVQLAPQRDLPRVLRGRQVAGF